MYNTQDLSETLQDAKVNLSNTHWKLDVEV